MRGDLNKEGKEMKVDPEGYTYVLNGDLVPLGEEDPERVIPLQKTARAVEQPNKGFSSPAEFEKALQD